MAQAADLMRSEQLKDIEQTNQQIKQLEIYKDDYKRLQERLGTLADKVRHNVMVPFGKYAFMPGQLVHTNELLVLLGDNWFAERSAKQAADIVQRRIIGIDNQIEGLQQQKGLLEPRVDVASEVKDVLEQKDGLFEIKEEYDPEKEKAWREQHRSNLQEYHKLKKHQREVSTESEECKSPFVDEALWERLDLLEQEELEKGELERSSDGEDVRAIDGRPAVTPRVKDTDRKSVRFKDPPDISVSTATNETDNDNEKKSVLWKDPPDSPDESGSTDTEEYESAEEDEYVKRSNVIRLTHTNISSSAQVSSESVNPKNDSPVIRSPGDIYKYFGQPKSILKSPTSDASPAVTEQPLEPSQPLPIPADDIPKAFTGAVVETTHPDLTTPLPTVQTTVDDSAQEPPKRISKFKAQRMQRATKR